MSIQNITATLGCSYCCVICYGIGNYNAYNEAGIELKIISFPFNGSWRQEHDWVLCSLTTFRYIDRYCNI